MRQAIITKYLGPTNHRGSRVKATCDAKSITLPWRSELNSESNHFRAASELQRLLGWEKQNVLIGGSIQNGYVFVQIEKEKS
jgi:hypothetical protein